MKAARWLWVGVLLLTGCDRLTGGTEPYRPPAVAASPAPTSGKELYLRDCAWCHGGSGEGSEVGPDLTSGTNGPALTDFALSTGRMPLRDVDDVMKPGKTVYTREQIDAIVEFTEGFEQEGPGVPSVNLAGAALQHGGLLYQENCAACHSTTAVGGALTRGSDEDDRTSSLLAPDLFDSTPVEVAEAVRTGPGTMPVFGADTFSDKEVNDIVRYVAYLQEPEDRGGAGIGRIGPVAEGAIGWVVGLGLLLVFSRWVGTKRGED